MLRPNRTPRLLGLFAWTAIALLAVGAAAGSGCSGDDTVIGTGGSGATSAGTTTGQSTGGTAGSGGLILTGGGSSTGGADDQCTPPCDQGEICSHGVCVPEQSCTDDEDCDNDTYCDPAVGCRPWESRDPQNDPGCVQAIPVGVFAPTVQCEFDEAPAGDPFPQHLDVQGTPVVVNFNRPMDSGPASIIASFCEYVPPASGSYYEDRGVIRVLDGKDCSAETVLGGVDLDQPPDGNVEWTVSSASVATGDLDGDGIAEIVAFGDDGELLAFTRKLDDWQYRWSLLWKAPYPTGAPWSACNHTNHRCSLGWASPSIHDLDDDGSPEVIREGVVYSSTGAVLSLGPPNYASYSVGLHPVLANLDADPNVELTNGAYIWQWEGGAWVQESTYPANACSPAANPGPGLVAVADFGDYGATLPASAPELAVVRAGFVTVCTIHGEVVQAPIAVPGGGSGGPPTVSDFDGDGLAELAVAARGAYTVYDLDCGPSPRSGGSCPPPPANPGVPPCEGEARCDFDPGGATINAPCTACPAQGGIAWSRATQDFSSSVTGSSLFDFEDDGSAEVVYADECFTRVYDGLTGDVIFSQYRSSCTWHENPIVADVDGDFRAELVTPSNLACADGGQGRPCTVNVDGDNVDLLYNGLRCDTGADCVSGNCDAGLCRCSSTAECCAAGTVADCEEQGHFCAPPNAGTVGGGNTCRARHPHGVRGIRVYTDENDLWVKSRQIWNQHAYHVTHVEEDGSIPQSSAWQNNWDDPLLNNFRQNVPGEADGSALGDATAGASDLYACHGNEVTLRVDVCNRGATAVPPGIVVGFYVGGNLVCSATTSGAILPEACEQVSCVWDDPPTTAADAVDVDVVADDGGGVTECKEENNAGIILGVYCQPPA